MYTVPTGDRSGAFIVLWALLVLRGRSQVRAVVEAAEPERTEAWEGHAETGKSWGHRDGMSTLLHSH